MPPKKKPAKEAEVPDRDIVALRRLLELKNYEAVEARALERGWRERAEVAEAALEQAKADMADIKADMARQHTTLQDHATQQVHVLEARVSELQSQLAAAQKTAHSAAAQTNQLLQAKEQQSLHHQQDVQRLHSQFAALLQDTLGSMRARLEEEYGAACGAS